MGENLDPFQEGYEKFVTAELILQKEIKQNDVISSIVCGALAGVCAKTVIAPAERIKMTFQVSPDLFTLRNAAARAKMIVSTQGVLSLWRGHSMTVLRVAPYSGASYAIHDYSEHKFKEILKTDKLPTIYKFLAGSLAGSGGTLLTYPLDVMRVRLAMNRDWRQSVKQGGLFQGLFPTLLGIIPYSGTAWCVKQTLLEELFPAIRHKKPTLIESLSINAFAGLCGQFVTYPLDIVRRRMQIAVQVEGVDLHNFRQVLRHLVQTEGWKGLSKGFSLNVIKGPIALSISLTTYDLLKGYIHRMGDVTDSDIEAHRHPQHHHTGGTSSSSSGSSNSSSNSNVNTGSSSNNSSKDRS